MRTLNQPRLPRVVTCAQQQGRQHVVSGIKDAVTAFWQFPKFPAIPFFCSALKGQSVHRRFVALCAAFTQVLKINSHF
jgi:hypothetical protein